MTSFGKLSDRAMLASVSMSAYNPRRIDKNVSEEVADNKGASKDAGKYVKNIIGPHHMKQITSLQGQARLTHYALTFPGFTQRGPRILASVGFLEHTQRMSEYRGLIEGELASLVRQLPTILSARRNELKDMWNEDEFPTVEEIQSSFSFDADYYPIPDSQNWILDLDDEIVEGLKEDLRDEVLDTLTGTANEAFGRVRRAVEGMRDKLENYSKPHDFKGGRFPGDFTSTLITNIKDLAETLPLLNISGDPKMDSLGKEIIRDLCGNDAKYLKETDHVRKSVAIKADHIADKVKGWMEAA